MRIIGGLKSHTLSWFLILALSALSGGCAPRPIAQRQEPAIYPGLSPRYHVVQRGETMWRIARQYGVTVEEMAGYNGISDPTRVEVGQRLYVPAVSRRNAKRDSSIPLAPEKSGKNPPRFIWPVKGDLIQDLAASQGLNSLGVDIAAPMGEEVRAADSGRVVYADDKLNYYGKMVILRHENTLFTVYAHNHENLVQPDQWVERGQVIARVGQSGRVSTPCLHFEIRDGEKPLNPMEYLP